MSNFKQTIGIGIVAGMRSMMAPAAVSRHLSGQRTNSKILQLIQSPVAVKLLQVLAAGEVVGDKVPTAPNRIELPGVTARVLTGALAAAAINKAQNKSVLAGAAIGGIAALASTYGFFYLRRYISSLPHVKDYGTGAAEDILAIALSKLIFK